MMKRMVIALLLAARKAVQRQGNYSKVKVIITLHFAVAPLVVAAAALVVVVAVGLALPASRAIPTGTDSVDRFAPPADGIRPTPTETGNYDADKDGLIEVSNLAQLAAIRADLNGDGVSPAPAYAAAFPNAIPGMGCPDAGCAGYELVADLDFDTNGNGKADAGDAYWNDGKGWIPIGDKAHIFITTFEGNGHTIANLYIDHSDASYVGLFGYVDANSSISRVGLVSVSIPWASCGGCGNGGLVGRNYGTITDSYVTGNVSGASPIGGLAGWNAGTISRSHATTDVSGSHKVGGLVGSSSGAIIASYATGRVAGKGDDIGGLVGRIDGGSGSISSSYAMGSVSGLNYVGGLVGSSGGAIIASYATGSVAGKGDDIGGLVGRNIIGGTIAASYAVGRVSTQRDDFYIGGLIGYDEDGDTAASASYYDTETTGLAGGYGGGGKTTAELQSPSGYTGIYEEWNSDLDGDDNADDPWDFGNTRQYPVLKYGGLDVAAQRQ